MTVLDKKRLTQIRSMLRRAWMRDPERFAILNDPKTKRKNKSDNKRLKWEHKCNACNRWFPAKDIQIDHKNPCGSFTGTAASIGKFVKGLFCSVNNLQKICRACHTSKTQQERLSRKGS